MNRLLIVRHGENRANLTKEFSYRLIDYPLTPKGRLQAQQTADYLRAFEVSHVFSSPLKRARETADIIAEAVGTGVTELEVFRELDVGRLEAEPPSAANWQLHDEIVWAWATGNAEARFPEGENYTELVARVREGYKSVLEGRSGETIVLVAHGGSLALPLLELVPDLDKEILRRTVHHNCAVGELHAAVEDGALTLSLERWATADHLHGEAAAFVAGSPQEGELE
jgi:broad specificity phosphatase PhoE